MLTQRLDHLPRLRLGDTCKLLGITPRAFRFYEEQGLIESHRDSLGHRMVDGATRRRVAWIVQLRRVGLTIKEIRGVLLEEEARGAGVDLALSRLAVRRRRVQEELTELDLLVADLTAGVAHAAPVSVAA